MQAGMRQIARLVLLLTLVAGAAPAVGAQSRDSGLAIVHGLAVHDRNRSGAAEAGEAGVAGAIAFIDRDGNGDLDEDEPRARTDAQGVFRLVTLLPGLAAICLDAPMPWVRTTPRCQRVSLAAGASANQLVFGLDQFDTRCPGGGVIDTVIGIGAPGEPPQPPTALAGPARGPWAGSRLTFDARSGAPIVLARPGEHLQHLLTLAPHSTLSRPVVRLTPAPGRERVVRIMAADGTVAAFAGRGRRLPSPRPTTFAYFDHRGEIVVFNPPRRSESAAFLDVIVVTQVRTGAQSFSFAARLDSVVRVDGQTLATCRDRTLGRGYTVRR